VKSKLDKKFYGKFSGWSFVGFGLCALCLLFDQFPKATPDVVKYGLTILFFVLTFVFMGFRAMADRPVIVNSESNNAKTKQPEAAESVGETHPATD